jgi:hypothetical protein
VHETRGSIQVFNDILPEGPERFQMRSIVYCEPAEVLLVVIHPFPATKPDPAGSRG